MIYNRIIDGTDIMLRSLELSDCTSSYVSWMQDKMTNYYMETRWIEQNEDTIQEFVNKVRNSEDSYLFAILEKNSQKHIGNIKIGPIDRRYHYADISYFIGEKDFHGKGYASQAVALICDFGFSVLGLHRLQAGVIEGNTASEKVLKKCGFILEGTFRDKNMLEGKYVKTYLFAKINDRDKEQ